MPNAKKDITFKMRLTAEEYEKLKSQSERTGLTMSSVMRSAWKRLKIVELPPADFTETVTQLRRIGSNLNQFTRAANMGEVHIPQIQEVLSEIAAIDRKLTKILAGGEAAWQ